MRYACISLLLLTIASAASAQTAPEPPPSPTLTVERIQSGWLVAPDVRATDLNGRAGALAGGYLGRITDRTLVFGAGAYVLANQDDDFKLWYGGPVIEWLMRADRRIGFGVRALVGAGSGTLAVPAVRFVDPRSLAAVSGRNRSPRSNLRLIDPEATVAVRDDFFVAEPQVNVMWNMSAGRRLVFGLGYRAVGNAPLLGDELSGLSGSVAFQLGGK